MGTGGAFFPAWPALLRATTCCVNLPLKPRCPLPLTPRSFVIKKAEQRYKELADLGIAVRMICVGRKGSAYFKRRPQYNVEANFTVGQSPTIKEAQAIADDIFSDFVSQVQSCARWPAAGPTGLRSPAESWSRSRAQESWAALQAATHTKRPSALTPRLCPALPHPPCRRWTRWS